MAADFIVVIPARYASSRFPGKALADIAGRPMIAWVHERACRSGAAQVLIATDDNRIAEACESFGATVELTRADHLSGSDRIAEVAARLGWADEQIVVNVQGDEPLLPPALISQAAELLASRADAAIATLITPVKSAEEWHDPNVAKVVVDRNANALYFSRAPIPWPLQGVAAAPADRHVGLYAYRAGALKALAAAPVCEIEQVEQLEQLRALWLGYRVVVAQALEEPPSSVDTPADLEAVRKIVKSE